MNPTWARSRATKLDAGATRNGARPDACPDGIVDAARAYLLAPERGTTGGPFHAIAEDDVPFKAIAEVIGRRMAVACAISCLVATGQIFRRGQAQCAGAPADCVWRG